MHRTLWMSIILNLICVALYMAFLDFFPFKKQNRIAYCSKYCILSSIKRKEEWKTGRVSIAERGSMRETSISLCFCYLYFLILTSDFIILSSYLYLPIHTERVRLCLIEPCVLTIYFWNFEAKPTNNAQFHAADLPKQRKTSSLIQTLYLAF